jgi:UDP-N-acetylmuramoylalanine--D-glutamate ligase
MRVAIVGYGLEGKSALRYWLDRGAEVAVYDQKEIHDQLPEGVTTHSGGDVFEQLNGYDIVMRSPGVPPDHITTDGRVSSGTNEFFEHCPAPIIGVTGSKGKGTTCSLIYAMLQQAGIRAHLVGNIGVPALDILADVRPTDVVVYELSSFQLWDLRKSPHVAVVLMIEPEHLDIHGSLVQYVAAKTHIVGYQSADDIAIYHAKNPFVAEMMKYTKAHKIPYLTPPGAFVRDGWFMIADQKVCSIHQMQLVGVHNLENVCAAITAAWQYTQDSAAITRAISGFKGLDHRLKLIRIMDGVGYYDDSIATTPGSVMAAIAALSGPKILIIGGIDKGVDFTDMATAIAAADMRHVLIIGRSREKIQASLDKAGFHNYQLFDERSSMNDIVMAAKKLAEADDKVILSPACASFDMFKDYKDRGDQFIAAVKAL